MGTDCLLGGVACLLCTVFVGYWRGITKSLEPLEFVKTNIQNLGGY